MEIQKQINIDQGINISQNDLKEIFLVQYNDLFNKLLKKSVHDFISLLKQQIILHLRIINKQCDFSLLTDFYEKYQKKANDDKIKITKLYNKIKSYQEKDLNHLNMLDTYIHCCKCKEVIHKCGKKLIIFDEYIFCIKCKKVYNEFQIKLFCKECNKTYLTTKRNISEKKNNYLYSVSYMKYHCFSENEEKIKCLNCCSDLYYNININLKTSKSKEQNKLKGIKDIFCIQCKLIFDTSEVLFTCKICREKFKAEPQIFRNFPSIKKYLLLLVHTFRKNIYALPDIISNKKCTCDLNGVQYFLHKDNGRLYEGSKNGKTVIICDHCYEIFKFESFNWNCPLCGGSFNAVKNNKSMRFNKNKKKISATNTNLNKLNINNDEEKIKKVKRKKNLNINKYSNNHIFYNSIAYSNKRNDNYESSKHLPREFSLTNKRINSNILDIQENINSINKVDLYNSDKKLVIDMDDSKIKEINTTTKKNDKINEATTKKLSSKYKQIKPAQLFKDNNNKTIIKINNSINNDKFSKEENQRSMSNLNKNYNINKDINNINENSPKREEQKNRALSSFGKVIISDSKSLFNIKESICEESLETSSDKKKFRKFQNTNIENVLPQNLFLKKGNKNCNNNNISISINNNVIQLRCSPNIKATDNTIETTKLKTRKVNNEKNLLYNNSSSKLIKNEKDLESNNIPKNNKIMENNENNPKIKGKSAQKTNYNKVRLKNEKDMQILHNISNIGNELLVSQSINNKCKNIKRIKKIINTKDKGQILNEDNNNNINITNNKKIIKDESKKILRRKINKNEKINSSKNNDLDNNKDTKNIHSEKKPNIVTKFSLINVENKNLESIPVKKINKVKIKKISDNQINKNIKIINSSKNSNPNVYIITNLSKTSNSNNETKKIYNVMVTNSKKDNKYLNIITDENNNILYTIPNSTKNKNKKNNKIGEIIKENDKKNIINNDNEIQKDNNIHKKNNLSFHINNINEIKNLNTFKQDIIVINNKKKGLDGINIINNEISPEIIKTKNCKKIKKKKKKILQNKNVDNNTKEINEFIIKNNKINADKNENLITKNNNFKINTDDEINNISYINNKNILSNIPTIIPENKKKIILNNININDTEKKYDAIKNYFSSIEQEITLNKRNRLSFDIRDSKNNFSLSTNYDNFEVKTFDSNYYTILRQIGKGSYGKIYLVEDPKTKDQFALKKIMISDSLELRENQEEYKLTWKLTNLNPELKIVKKYAVEIKKLDKYNLVMYVLMEVANCDWEQELINRQKDNAFYTEEELIEILKSLVNTLAELQKKGVSHRDIKPQNILCFGKDGYKLSDFGEAKAKIRTYIKSNNYDENTRKQTVRGTELYMSPILFKALQMNAVDGAQYNAYKSDVFSLGMCFLLASTLNYQSLYEIREVYDMNILKEIVMRYLKNYSKNYMNLIINMLQINEKERPDFIELNSMIV